MTKLSVSDLKELYESYKEQFWDILEESKIDYPGNNARIHKRLNDYVHSSHKELEAKFGEREATIICNFALAHTVAKERLLVHA